MGVKAVLISISAGALAAFVAYNTCRGEELNIRSVEIIGDRYTLTIEAKFDYGETGNRRYVWQQFDDDEGCFSRSIESQDCPNERRNDGTLYSCNGLMFRDYGCNNAVNEFGYKVIARGAAAFSRTQENELFFREMGIDKSCQDIVQEMEALAGINLEEEVEEWRRTRE